MFRKGLVPVVLGSALSFALLAANVLAVSEQTAELSATELALVEPLVRGHCSACHSLALVAAQRGDEKFWRNTIRWMQKTQQLWEIPPDQERKIIAYLSQIYAEEGASRRPPLPLSLQDDVYWPTK